MERYQGIADAIWRVIPVHIAVDEEGENGEETGQVRVSCAVGPWPCPQAIPLGQRDQGPALWVEEYHRISIARATAYPAYRGPARLFVSHHALPHHLSGQAPALSDVLLV